MMKYRILILFLFLIPVISCHPALYQPMASDPNEQSRLTEGRSLYVDHCGTCHNLHLPSEYDRAGWQIQLDKMQSRAHVDEAQKALILAYLTAY